MAKKEKKLTKPKEFMQLAIDLAKKGHGYTNPNPMVGAVIVKNGEIIGQGYHERYGELHAERNALASCEVNPEGADMYVTLEPCCHYGQTPPCTEAIIENKIGRVYVGSADPNPKVAGKGIQQLRDAGIEVIEDFMREECDAINDVFFHYITKNIPYVTLKYAMTADGKIATKSGKSKWITGTQSRKKVHELRHQNAAIMVGIGTVLADDPMLDCRLGSYEFGGDEDVEYLNPVRVICDSSLRIPLDSRLVMSAGKIRTIVATEGLSAGSRLVPGENMTRIEKARALQAKGVDIIYTPIKDGHISIKTVLEYLGKEKIDSVLVEGGGQLAYSMMENQLVDRVIGFVAPKVFGGIGKSPVEGKGIETPQDAYQMHIKDVQRTGDDVMIEFIVDKR